MIILKPEGIYVPNVTPFNNEGEIMYDALGELVEYWIKGGITGIVANASTGEAPYLSRDEKIKIIQYIKEKAGNRAKVYAGTGAMSTWETIELTKDAKDAGAEGINLVGMCCSGAEMLSRHLKICHCCHD